mmetsp:Transcript_90367/g.149754  ORF Transcript_90367/g.149754 Transcript_90367/m.149754 type:complete len:113 (-) Transcript_90367:312-650(-)
MAMYRRLARAGMELGKQCLGTDALDLGAKTKARIVQIQIAAKTRSRCPKLFLRYWPLAANRNCFSMVYQNAACLSLLLSTSLVVLLGGTWCLSRADKCVGVTCLEFWDCSNK